MASSEDKSLKIQQYEAFVDQRLKPDLVKATASRDEVLEQLKVFSDLAKNIKLLEKNRLSKLRTKINLGSEIYVQAEVFKKLIRLVDEQSKVRPDTSRIFVDIGLGFHVEFTWSEALKFVSVKESLLKRQVEEHTRQISYIKAQIKLVCEGIRELMNFPAAQ